MNTCKYDLCYLKIKWQSKCIKAQLRLKKHNLFFIVGLKELELNEISAATNDCFIWINLIRFMVNQ